MLSCPENFQLPLFASLAISPVCLLMSTTLFERSVGKEHLLEVRRFLCLLTCFSSILQFWLVLGNQRPPVLEEIERILWEILLGTINNPDTLPTLLQTGMEKIDMDKVGQLDDQALGLFRAGELLTQRCYFRLCDLGIGPALATFNVNGCVVGRVPPQVGEEEAELHGDIEDKRHKMAAAAEEEEDRDRDEDDDSPEAGTKGGESMMIDEGPCGAIGADGSNEETGMTIDGSSYGGGTASADSYEQGKGMVIDDGPNRETGGEAGGEGGGMTADVDGGDEEAGMTIDESSHDGGTAGADSSEQGEGMVINDGAHRETAGGDSSEGGGMAADEKPDGGVASADDHGGNDMASDDDAHPGARRSGCKRKPAVPPLLPSKPTPRPKKRKRPVQDPKPRKKSKRLSKLITAKPAQNPTIVPAPVEPRGYFQLINDGGVMKIVEMIDLTSELVSLL
jgi:hypothetical protein